jgi:dipeptidase D
MVCEKNKSVQHDFDNDPIILKKDDGWIAAVGTTLGSDNGIGIAAAISIITDKEVIHGPLEILLTVDEETGLTGAHNLEAGLLSGNTLLNLDSEDDGAFFVGCAGGLDTIGYFQADFEDVPSDYNAFELTVSGLKGGHSGVDINSGRANAIKILARTLNELDSVDFLLGSAAGGSKRNAIPREAEALLFIKPSSLTEAERLINNFQRKLSIEFKTSDGGLKVELKKVSACFRKVFTSNFKNKLINVLLALPHGVISMSRDIPDLVETSTNLATLIFEKNVLTIGTCQRSSIESAKEYITDSTAAVFTLAGAKIETTDGYPGWKPDMDSVILKISKKVFKDLFKKEPLITAIHAGLECGILGNRKPGLDMISFGPTIINAHSPDERVNIETVERFYELLKGILKEIAVKK